MDEVKIGAIYRNIKNQKLYRVKDISYFTEVPYEMEFVVNYEALYKVELERNSFTRPLDLFKVKFEEVKED